MHWIINESQIILPCSKLAITDTGLSQMANVRNKADFTIALAVGLGQQLKIEYRESFLQQVRQSLVKNDTLLSGKLFVDLRMDWN